MAPLWTAFPCFTDVCHKCLVTVCWWFPQQPLVVGMCPLYHSKMVLRVMVVPLCHVLRVIPISPFSMLGVLFSYQFGGDVGSVGWVANCLYLSSWSFPSTSLDIFPVYAPGLLWGGIRLATVWFLNLLNLVWTWFQTWGSGIRFSRIPEPEPLSRFRFM